MAKFTFASSTFKSRTFKSATLAGPVSVAPVTPFTGNNGGGQTGGGGGGNPGIPIPEWMLSLKPSVRRDLLENMEFEELLILTDFDFAAAESLMEQLGERRKHDLRGRW